MEEGPRLKSFEISAEAFSSTLGDTSALGFVDQLNDVLKKREWHKDVPLHVQFQRVVLMLYRRLNLIVVRELDPFQSYLSQMVKDCLTKFEHNHSFVEVVNVLPSSALHETFVTEFLAQISLNEITVIDMGSVAGSRSSMIATRIVSKLAACAQPRRAAASTSMANLGFIKTHLTQKVLLFIRDCDSLFYPEGMVNSFTGKRAQSLLYSLGDSLHLPSDFPLGILLTVQKVNVQDSMEPKVRSRISGEGYTLPRSLIHSQAKSFIELCANYMKDVINRNMQTLCKSTKSNEAKELKKALLDDAKTLQEFLILHVEPTFRPIGVSISIVYFLHSIYATLADILGWRIGETHEPSLNASSLMLPLSPLMDAPPKTPTGVSPMFGSTTPNLREAKQQPTLRSAQKRHKHSAECQSEIPLPGIRKRKKENGQEGLYMFAPSAPTSPTRAGTPPRKICTSAKRTMEHWTPPPSTFSAFTSHNRMMTYLPRTIAAEVGDGWPPTPSLSFGVVNCFGSILAGLTIKSLSRMPLKWWE